MSRQTNYCYNCQKSQKVYTNIDYDHDEDYPMQVLKVICCECHRVIDTICADDEAFTEYLFY